MFEQLDGQIAGRVEFTHVLFLLEMLLYLTDTMFYLVAMVDMDMTIMRLRVFCALIHFDDLMEEFVDTFTGFKHCWHHRHAKQLRQLVVVDMVTTFLGLIKHVQRNHHTDVHVNELCRKIKIALQVGGVNHIDDNIRSLFDQLLSDI